MNLALFDLDNTLLTGDSDHAWGDLMADCGIVDRHLFRKKNNQYYTDYCEGRLDIHEYLDFALSPVAGKSDADLAPLQAKFLAERIEAMIGEPALALLAQHQGDLRAIVTATNAVVTRPIAERFGVPHLIACEAEKIDGRYTGRGIGVPSFREGKITRVHDWLTAMGKTLQSFPKSFFYSDSINDLPLLEVVSHPVAVDPDAALLLIAQKRGWPVISLHAGRQSPRNAAMTSEAA